MNKERLKTISDWLKGGAKHVDETGNVFVFDMRWWHVNTDDMTERSKSRLKTNECGTVMCIGGAAEQFFGFPEDYDDDTGYDASEAAMAEVLGLDQRTADQLFYPWYYVTEENSIDNPFLEDELNTSPEICAQVIDHLIETGEVDWTPAIPKQD